MKWHTHTQTPYWHTDGPRLALLMVIAWLPAMLAGCAGPEVPPVEAAPDEPDLPVEVVRARESVLDFLREGSYGLMPSPVLEWDARVGGENMPDGFGIYFFSVENSIMSVTYPLPVSDETLYHVSYGDTVAGLCWQAMVDADGRIVKTGSDAELGADDKNVSYVYCTQEGYDYEVRIQSSGGPCGTCVFPDGSSCIGWAFLRGQCGPGDRPAESE